MAKGNETPAVGAVQSGKEQEEDTACRAQPLRRSTSDGGSSSAGAPRPRKVLRWQRPQGAKAEDGPTLDNSVNDIGGS
jgi:hypothetical protein